MHMSRNGEYEEENIGGAFQLAEAVPEIDIILQVTNTLLMLKRLIILGY